MATRSPSPNPTRSTNPNPKTPESNCSIRKSGNSNFSKPSIPSDLPQRKSGSKAGIVLPCLRASFDQKENERDPNFLQPARARSPATPSLKGTKNFMAPTISASSKVTSASPRKKILTERNENLRSSQASVSDSLECPAIKKILSKSEMGFGALPLLDASKASRVSSEGVENIKMMSEMGFCSKEISCTHQDLKNVDHQTKKYHSADVSCFSPSPSIAPLDADPSLPPYDPETNYLSPRPRFLRYKPNARVEHYLNKEEDLFNFGDGQRLEDSFSSQSCEDTTDSEHTNDEAETFYLQKDSEEDSSSPEMESQEDTDETHVPQFESKSKPNRNHLNSCSFNRSKFAPLLLVLVIACLFFHLTDSPIISSSLMLKDQPFKKFNAPALRVFDDPYLRKYLAEIAVFANSNLEGLANKLRQWSAYYTTFGSIPKEESGYYHLVNLTASAVDQTIYFSHSETKPNPHGNCEGIEMEQAIKENVEEEEEEESSLGHGTESKIEMEVLEEENENGDSPGEGETERKIEMEVLEEENENGDSSGEGETEQKIEMEVLEEVNENGDSPGEGETEKKIAEDGVEKGKQEDSHPPGHKLQDIDDEVGNEEHANLFHYLPTEPETVENQEDSINHSSLTQIQPAGFGHSLSESGQENQISHGRETCKYKSVRQEDELLRQTILGISLVILTLAAALIFLHLKHKQPSTTTHKKLPPKKISPSIGSYTPARRFLDQNLPGSVAMMGDSTLSEVNSSDCGRQRTKGGKEEILSHERMLRRDSAASSISYGSFTTYEKLSAKKGCGDEDAVTPVRRSSRIRNQVHMKRRREEASLS